MMNTGATVSAELGLSLVVPEHGAVPLVASLCYGAADPYAIRMAFHVGTEDPVEWIFSRDLLSAGLAGPAGEGDVQVWPARTTVSASSTSRFRPHSARPTSKRQ